MTMNTMHPLAPTESERAAIQAGLDYWDSIPWTDGPQGMFLTDDDTDEARRHPAVQAAAEAYRSWVRRTCPSWCTRDHLGLRALVTISADHSCILGVAKGVGRAVTVSVDMAYSEDEGSPSVEGPEINVYGETSLTSDQAATLAGWLMDAREVLEAASR